LVEHLLTCAGLERFLSIDLGRRRRRKNKNKKIYRSPIVPSSLVSNVFIDQIETKERERETGKIHAAAAATEAVGSHRSRAPRYTRFQSCKYVQDKRKRQRRKSKKTTTHDPSAVSFICCMRHFLFRPKEEEKVK
jgi:hypothetical protein